MHKQKVLADAVVESRSALHTNAPPSRGASSSTAQADAALHLGVPSSSPIKKQKTGAQSLESNYVRTDAVAGEPPHNRSLINLLQLEPFSTRRHDLGFVRNDIVPGVVGKASPATTAPQTTDRGT